MRQLVIVVFLLSAVATGVIAQAQSANPLAGYLGFLPTETLERSELSVGCWALYESKDENGVGKIKFSIVGKEKDSYWLEIATTDKDGEHSVTKMLFAGDPREETTAVRIIMKHGDEPALELPTIEFSKPDRAGIKAKAEETDTEEQEPKSEIKEIGKEELTVAGRKLETTHYKIRGVNEDGENEEVDVWLSPEVPFIPVVKVMKPESGFQLVDFGKSGAKSEITEEPKKIELKLPFEIKGEK
ncbi:hypothetical protein J7K18_02140 [bacterium]|nr:hypothetical protein [bacterium]